MNAKLIQYGTPRYGEMVALRRLVLRKPLGLEFTEQDLLRDKNDILCGCFNNDIMTGVCILSRIDKDTMQLRQMAVHDHYRGKGAGNQLLSFAEDMARKEHIVKLILHARKTAVSFYLKAGYEITSDEFTEVGIPHLGMQKTL